MSGCQAKMLREVLSLTDMQLSLIKKKISHTFPWIPLYLMLKSKDSRYVILIWQSSLYSVMNMVMLRHTLILWLFGKANSVTSLMRLKLSQIQWFAQEKTSGMLSMVWSCFSLMVMMGKVQSTLQLELRDIFSFAMKMIPFQNLTTLIT
jgi:hypothetical protein